MAMVKTVIISTLKSTNRNSVMQHARIILTAFNVVESPGSQGKFGFRYLFSLASGLMAHGRQMNFGSLWRPLATPCLSCQQKERVQLRAAECTSAERRSGFCFCCSKGMMTENMSCCRVIPFSSLTRRYTTSRLIIRGRYRG
jgi:hypothetical protein